MCSRCMGVNFGGIYLVRIGGKNSKGNDCRKISVPMLTDERSLINL